MDSSVLIKSVWKDNFEEEMGVIRDVIRKYPFISLTTRLLLCRDRVPATNAWGDLNVNYATLLQMADNYKDMVQVGLSFSDKQGKLSVCQGTGRTCVWEFNLVVLDEAGGSRDVGDAGEEEQFLQECCGGVDVQKMRTEGIHPGMFAIELWQCNVLMHGHVCWVVFKGGLDFVSLLRWVRHSVQALPPDREQFLNLLGLYFPLFYDVAALLGLHHEDDNDGTIDSLAKLVNIEREDEPPFGAASDSLLALRLFTQVMRLRMGAVLLRLTVKALFGITVQLGTSNA